MQANFMTEHIASVGGFQFKEETSVPEWWAEWAAVSQQLIYYGEWSDQSDQSGGSLCDRRNLFVKDPIPIDLICVRRWLKFKTFNYKNYNFWIN